ncbi:MAG: hypothetical protein WC088_06105 [Candidatus Izemoplasmatales bacterium]
MKITDLIIQEIPDGNQGGVLVVNISLDREHRHGYIEKDGFLFGKIFRYKGAIKDAIYFDSKLSFDDVEYINQHGLNKVILDFRYEEATDLSFLCNIEKLEFLDIYGTIDASLIDSLANLRFLRVNSSTSINLGKFPNLEWISSYTPNQLVGFEELKNLKSASLLGGNELCSQKILDIVGSVPTIDTLVLERSVMRDLSFIRGVPNLQVLILKENARLSNLRDLENNNKSLKCLKIIRTTKIDSYSEIGEVLSLEFLYIDNCRAISSISFINNLKNLKGAVIAKTNILDGNLSPLMNLDYGVAIPIKKHYYSIQNGIHSHIKLEQYSSREIEHGNQNIDLWRKIDTW